MNLTFFFYGGVAVWRDNGIHHKVVKLLTGLISDILNCT